MAKIDQEIKELKSSVKALADRIDKMQFYLVQIMNKVSEDGIAPSGGTPAPASGPISVDITPLEDRIDQLSKEMVSKKDLEPITQELTKIRDEKLKEAEDTIDNVTVLLEKGLALTEFTASLKEIEAHLLELVKPPK